VELIDETFTNIGAFTAEKLSEVLQAVKGDNITFVSAKPHLSLTDWIAPINGLMVNHRFFTDSLSSSLLYGSLIGMLRIAGRCVFSNIWLIDRKNAL
jgi:hypothetical protein